MEGNPRPIIAMIGSVLGFYCDYYCTGSSVFLYPTVFTVHITCTPSTLPQEYQHGTEHGGDIVLLPGTSTVLPVLTCTRT
jgi:hypothetical protein